MCVLIGTTHCLQLVQRTESLEHGNTQAHSDSMQRLITCCLSVAVMGDVQTGVGDAVVEEGEDGYASAGAGAGVGPGEAEPAADVPASKASHRAALVRQAHAPHQQQQSQQQQLASADPEKEALKAQVAALQAELSKQTAERLERTERALDTTQMALAFILRAQVP